MALTNSSTQMNRVLVSALKWGHFGRPCRAVSFLSGSNSNYIEELYSEWKKDSTKVHKSWDLVFKASEKGANISDYWRSPPPEAFGSVAPSRWKTSALGQVQASHVIDEKLAVYGLIRAFQSQGHMAANLDPLGIVQSTAASPSVRTLTLEYWGLKESHLDTMFPLPSTTSIGGSRKEMSLREIISSLSSVYTSNIGVEYSHLEDAEKIAWLVEKIESPGSREIALEDKVRTLARLSRATMFEAFLSQKYPSEKRFGLEGCDVLVPSLKDIIDQSAEVGVESFVIGMAHRGRLNVLANVCRQPLQHILCRFNDELKIDDEGSSDVKYHLGVSRIVRNRKSGKDVNISIVANPSHLEAVDPVVKGKTKAEQFLRRDTDGSKVLSILIHGDAAFSGQGVVYETIHLSELPHYTIHGTIHVVTNNQIGFTTDPRFSRSSRYCTDVAKVVQAPIFHVNADDPEAVHLVSKLAAEYRNQFKKDVVVDLVGYRRNGHNEGDNPSFTQPLMYKVIASKPTCMDMYAKKLIDSGQIGAEAHERYVKDYRETLEADFSESKKCEIISNHVWLDSPWKDFFGKTGVHVVKPTGVDPELIKAFQKKCCEFPSELNLHPGLKRVINQRMEMLEYDRVDWAMAEIAAFATLLTEGIHIRLSGQDVERGTFSHRHHVLHDNEYDRMQYVPLNHLSESQARYVVCNSSLSEYAVLGFEHGYSMASPDVLSIWEGQFGDFSNTAQCIIDQFISSGEDKWIRQSGMVLLLPHGFDGMGPEHSSARLERFLQLSKEDADTCPNLDPAIYEVEQIRKNNYIVAYPTTPANFFHLLRRQLAFSFRKPLVVMSPKSLLRHELARSSLKDMAPGTSFQRVIGDRGPAAMNPTSVKRLIFCSGKIYYELHKARTAKRLDESVAIVRIEQLAPFPFDMVAAEIERYPNAELLYVQEEPKNQGAYSYAKSRLSVSCNNTRNVNYCGRCSSASPATGSKLQHSTEQTQVVTSALLFQ